MNPLMGGLIGVVLGVAVFLFATYNSGLYTNTNQGGRADYQQPHFNDESVNCSICLENLRRKRTRTLLCGHRFHEECIEKHIESRFVVPVNCPNCRAPL